MALPMTTDSSFENDVLKSDIPVVIDFYATWCAPCNIQTPILEQLSEKLGDKVKFFKLDVDQNPRIAQQFGIMSIPTLKIFKGGEEKQSFVGVTREDVLESTLENLL